MAGSEARDESLAMLTTTNAARSIPKINMSLRRRRASSLCNIAQSHSLGDVDGPIDAAQVIRFPPNHNNLCADLLQVVCRYKNWRGPVAWVYTWDTLRRSRS